MGRGICQCSEDIAEAYDLFAGALAAGDFDGDGHADLAVGVSGENVLGVFVAAALPT